jgi:hypothetical protein
MVDLLKAAYSEHCDNAKVSEKKRFELKTKFAEVLKILQIGCKAFYICRYDEYTFDTEVTALPLSNPKHSLWVAKRFTSKWTADFKDEFVMLKELVE